LWNYGGQVAELRWAGPFPYLSSNPVLTT